MTTFPTPIVWGPATLSQLYNATGVAGFVGTALDDADDSVAMVAFATRDGTIDTIGVYCTEVNGNPPAYNIGIVTVDIATGAPNAVAYGGSSIETYDFTAAGWVWVTLATPATAAAGDLFAIRVWPTGTAPDGTNHAHICWNNIFVSGQPWSELFSTAWAGAYLKTAMAARYSTGQIIGLPAVSFLFANVDSGTTPDEIGNKFSVPADMKCIGARISYRNRTAGLSHTVKLYDDSDNLLASFSSLVVYNSVTLDDAEKIDVFWDEVSLSEGATYRITILPENTTDSTISALDFESETSKNNAVPDGANWQATSRTNAGAWTDDASGVVWISLLISEITFSTGSGGGAYGFAG